MEHNQLGLDLIKTLSFTIIVYASCTKIKNFPFTNISGKLFSIFREKYIARKYKGMAFSRAPSCVPIILRCALAIVKLLVIYTTAYIIKHGIAMVVIK